MFQESDLDTIAKIFTRNRDKGYHARTSDPGLFNEKLGRLRQLFPGLFKISDTNLLSEEHGEDIAQLIGELPPEAALKRFGKTALLSAWLRMPIDRVGNNRFAEVLAEEFDCRSYILNQVRDMNQKGSPFKFVQTPDTAVTQIELGKALDKGAVERLSLSTYLDGNSRSHKPLPDKQKSNYHVNYTIARDGKAYGRTLLRHRDLPGDVIQVQDAYLDSPSGIMLSYGNNASAFVGFHATKPDTVLVNQMQGIRSYFTDKSGSVLQPQPNIVVERGLSRLNWGPMLVEMVSDIVKPLGIKRLGIQGTGNNRWIRTVDKGRAFPHLDFFDGMRAYDDIALRMGFTLKPGGNWYKDI